MTTPDASTRAQRLIPLLPASIVGLCLVWAFWPTLVELAQTWNTNPQYSHGFLVPGFAAFLLWMRRDRMKTEAFTPSILGLVLLAAGLGIRLAGTYYHFISLDAISLIPCVAGLVLVLGGRAAWNWAWPAVLFLGFMIPLPYFIANAMSAPLQRLATVTSTFVMQTLGLPALAEGNVILLNEHEIGIVEACSGLRMLVVFFALSTAMVLIINRHWVDKTIIILSAIPIAVISNIIRVTATGMMYEFGYSELAATFFHDVAGWLMMPLALGMLWVELKILSNLFIDAPAGVPRSTREAAPKRTATAPRPAVPRGNRRQPVTPREPAARERQIPEQETADKN